jgi:predicted transposase YdaD
MLGRSLEETRIYQDLEHQTKRKTAARLLRRGYSVENVAEDVDLPIGEVRQIAEQL